VLGVVVSDYIYEGSVDIIYGDSSVVTLGVLSSLLTLVSSVVVTAGVSLVYSSDVEGATGSFLSASVVEVIFVSVAGSSVLVGAAVYSSLTTFVSEGFYVSSDTEVVFYSSVVAG